ncbi:MAG: molybdopterin-synthase adenylyltransferase MoeB [Paracoccaceae bacterium]
MILVLGIAALIWFGGAKLQWPRTMRWVLLALLYACLLCVHLVLPDGHSLRMATGESKEFWLILGGGGILVLAYRWGLKKLQSKANSTQAAAPQTDRTGPFTDTELNRYARHIVLREIGGSGQKALKDAKILVIGAGGLGAPALQYLGAAGIGTIGIIDDDVVENANLQRQVIHTDTNINMPKVFSAQAALEAQNPFIKVLPYNRRLTPEIGDGLFAEYDLVLDGTDNFETRYLANRLAVAHKIPLISGALTQWEGQISVFDPAQGAPCYQCIFPETPAPELAPNCAEAGVLGPLPGVIGSMMAVEAVKVVTNAGTALRGQMMIYDALYGESRQIKLKPRADCPICGN